MAKYEPGMHKHIPMETRVRIPKSFAGFEAIGTVVGIASIHVIFNYIVLLDEPLPPYEGDTVRAICVPGPSLEGLDGSNWRLTE